jgi:hypothetical protein
VHVTYVVFICHLSQRNVRGLVAMNAVEVLDFVVLCPNFRHRGTSMTPVSCVHLSLLKLALLRHEQQNHLTENKGLSDEALSLASTRFVQAGSLSGTDMYYYQLHSELLLRN